MEPVDKGQNVVVGDLTRKTPGETCVDAMHEDQLFPQDTMPRPKNFLDMICNIVAALISLVCKCRTPVRKRQMLLDSATEDINLKTREVQKLKETIVTLKEANSKLEQKIEKIQQQLCKEKSGQHGSYVDGLQTPFLVESTAKTMFSSISTFSNLLFRYKDSNGNNPAHPFIRNSYERNRQLEGVHIAREHHWAYLLKDYVCCHLFENFETERFTGSVNAAVFLDPEERVTRYFEYFKNCNSDRRVWHRAIFHESSEKVDHLFFDYFAVRCGDLLPWDFNSLCELFQNHDERTGARIQEQILGLDLGKRKLVESLIVAAGKVWQFHKLCLSFEPPATIFRVAAGDPFNPDYMESIDVLENDDYGSLQVPKVAFMTYPGFRLRKSIVKCQVPESHLSIGRDRKTSRPGTLPGIIDHRVLISKLYKLSSLSRVLKGT